MVKKVVLGVSEDGHSLAVSNCIVEIPFAVNVRCAASCHKIFSEYTKRFKYIIFDVFDKSLTSLYSSTNIEDFDNFENCSGYWSNFLFGRVTLLVLLRHVGIRRLVSCC